MLRAFHQSSYTEAPYGVCRLPGLPRARPIVAARWLVTVLGRLTVRFIGPSHV